MSGLNKERLVYVAIIVVSIASCLYFLRVESGGKIIDAKAQINIVRSRPVSHFWQDAK